MQKLYAKKMFEEIPFNDLVQADDWDLIEGVNMPDNGADVTGDHQGDIDGSNINNDNGWTDDTVADVAQATALSKAKIFRQDAEPASGMVAGDIWIDTNDGDRPYSYNGSNWIETLTIIDGGKITTGTIDASVVTVNNIVAGNITSGTLLVARTEAKCTDANADETSANTSANTEKVQNYTIISGGKIATGMLTGVLIQTTTAANTGVKMSSALGGIVIYGLTFQLKDTSGVLYGYIGGDGGYYKIQTYNNRNILIDADAGTVHFGSEAAPLTDGGQNLGYYNFRWGNCYALNFTFQSSYYLNKSGTYLQLHGFSRLDCNGAELQTNIWRVDSDTSKYFQYTSGHFECNDDLYVGGALSKASGSFKIDHPLKPKTHWLEHSFVESPDMLNLYTGNGEIKNGEFKIKMPDWFIPLNGKNKDEFTYQLTSIGQFNNLMVKQEMNNKGEVIFAGEKDGKFSYMITAIRHDKWAENNRVKIESKKIIN